MRSNRRHHIWIWNVFDIYIFLSAATHRPPPPASTIPNRRHFSCSFNSIQFAPAWKFIVAADALIRITFSPFSKCQHRFFFITFVLPRQHRTHGAHFTSYAYVQRITAINWKRFICWLCARICSVFSILSMSISFRCCRKQVSSNFIRAL